MFGTFNAVGTRLGCICAGFWIMFGTCSQDVRDYVHFVWQILGSWFGVEPIYTNTHQNVRLYTYLFCMNVILTCF